MNEFSVNLARPEWTPPPPRDACKCFACICNRPLAMDLHLLEQVLSSGPHPHLLDDLLVQTGPGVLQFAASSLGKWVATLSKEESG